MDGNNTVKKKEEDIRSERFERLNEDKDRDTVQATLHPWLPKSMEGERKIVSADAFKF